MARRIICLTKIYRKISRFIIGLFSYIDHDVYMSKYIKHLRKYGMNIGEPIYIGNTTRFDGTDYSLITIEDRVVISSEVLFLTHDYSIARVKEAIDKKMKTEEEYKTGKIWVGRNSFIGVRATILPGTYIDHDCLIGACSVVKGNIAPFSIMIGNPARKIGDVRESKDAIAVLKDG